MCGIAGAISQTWYEESERMVQAIVASQYRRGPDHHAIERINGSQTQVVLGHNRLSIIDLTTQANQPMWDGDHRFCLVYNGEVYNYLELRTELSRLGHRFVTRSDSEVVIEAFKQWGLDALERFNGMFAFALYDARKETLWLVRDRFGVKPLYYYSEQDTLLFASTTRAIAEGKGLKPDLDYAARGLVYGIYDDDTEISAYRGLRALRPGHYLQVKTTRTGALAHELRAYYDLASRVCRLQQDIMDASLEALTKRVKENLNDAVSLRLRAAVPMGISLSGGLDSATLAAHLARHHEDITGFTFGDPRVPASEGATVQELSDRTRIGIHFVWPGGADFTRCFWETLEAQDAPFPGPSIVAQYMVFKAAAACGVKVLLGGQGGDELFMGYRKFQLFYFLELVERRQFVKALGVALGLLSVLIAEHYKIVEYFGHLRRYQGGARRDGTLRLPDPSPLRMGYDSKRPLRERQMQDVTRFSLPTLLRYEDRNSMGNSVESRLPFLDYRLVELALALPTAVKVHRGYGKWIIRRAASDMVVDSIRLARYKRPFDVNLGNWVSQGLGKSIRSRLYETLGKTRLFLAPGTSIEEAWSDAQLARRPAAFAEAVTLIWLGSRIR